MIWTWLLVALLLRLVLVLLYRKWHAAHPSRWLVQDVEPDYDTNRAEAWAFYYENGRWQ